MENLTQTLTPDQRTSTGQPVLASAIFEQVLTKFTPSTPEQIARVERWEAENARRAVESRRQRCVENLNGDLGRRFRDCSLAKFEIYDPAQKAVVDRLKRLQDDVVEHVQAGRGLFLYGNCGTGKDHLAIAVLRKAAWEGLSARFVNGIKLFGDVSHAWRRESSEGDVITPLTYPDVLLLSDPVLPTGITESNQRTLYRLVAGRYDRGQPTWVTMNVSGADQAVELLGRQVYDRLIDDAIRLHCSWPSFRERRKID